MQTLCVSYSTSFIEVSLCVETVNKSRKSVMDDAIAGFGVHYVLEKWFRQVIYDLCINEIILGSFGSG